MTGIDNINTKQRIIDTATRLIVEKGVNKTSLSDIAKAAGISKGTLFYYFAAKDDLIYDLTVQHFNKTIKSLMDRINKMQGQPLQTIMHEGIKTILMAEDRGKLNIYLLAEAVMDNEALRKRFQSTYMEYRKLMKEFVGSVSPNNENGYLLSTMLVALLDGLIIQWLIEPEAVSVEAIAGFLAGAIE